MKKPASMKALEELGRVRLSDSFFMREFLYSEISSFYGIPNIPDDPDLAISAGRKLCELILEPLQQHFGRLSIRSAYRSQTINSYGNKNRLNCSSNKASYGRHIWDKRDGDGNMGATACVVVNRFMPYFEATGDWQAMAWWIHDHLPYDELVFFPRLAAFNISWNEAPKRTIYSFIPHSRGYLTKPDRPNHGGDHKLSYDAMLTGLTGVEGEAGNLC